MALKDAFLTLVAIDGVDHEQDHGGLVEIVIESVQQLRAEQRQEAPTIEQMRGRRHDVCLKMALPRYIAPLT